MRQGLVEAAVEALRELSVADLVSAVGTRELARRAGASPTSLFYHFGSVQGFADAVLARVYDPAALATAQTHALIAEVRRGPVPLVDLLELHQRELVRLTTDPEMRVRVGVWALGGPEMDPVYGGYLAGLDALLAELVEAVFAGWGRALRAPYDLASFVATHGALLSGSAIRRSVDPEVSRPEVFARAAASLSVTAVGPRGDRRDVDDRLAAVNYFSERGAGSGAPAAGRGERTRDRILAAAGEQYEQRGYAATTLAQVARAAGLGVSTVTGHFGSRSGLAAALFRRQVQERFGEGPAAADPADGLRQRLGELARTTARCADHAPAYLVEAATHAPRQGGDPVVAVVRALLVELAAAGRIRAALGVDALADLLVVTTVSQVLAGAGQDLDALVRGVAGLVLADYSE